LAALACVLAADTNAFAQAAPPGETTVFTVIVTRHGVRAISDPPAKPAGYRWPDWRPVGKDELTAHGYRLMRLMGGFYRKEQARKGLPVDCDAKTAYVYADVPPPKPPDNPNPAQRTLGTAHALIEGLCATPDKPDTLAVFHAAEGHKDPIFDATQQLAKSPGFDGAKSWNAVKQAADPVKTIVDRHAAEFAAFQGLLAKRCDRPHCDPIGAGDSSIPKPTRPDQLAALIGPIATGSSFSEDVFLEFAQCREEDEIAKLDGQLRADLAAGMRLHVVAYDVNARNFNPLKPDARNVFNPLVRGGMLLARIAAMLDKKAGHAALGHIGVPPELAGATLVIFSGHDTQLGASAESSTRTGTRERASCRTTCPPAPR
jgi:hypothetical protein